MADALILLDTTLASLGTLVIVFFLSTTVLFTILLFESFVLSASSFSGVTLFAFLVVRFSCDSSFGLGSFSKMTALGNPHSVRE